MISLPFTFFSLVALIALLTYYLSKRKYSYWEKKKVPHIKPLTLFGNFKEYILRQKYEGYVAQEICQKFPNEPYVGTFFGTEPMLLVQDPELVKLVLTKDFFYFNGRAISKYTHKETVTQSLFFTYGDKWKAMRQNLTPLFSSAKMKNMFYIIKNCAIDLDNLLEKEIHNATVIEVRTLISRYTMDCIGSCAFGVSTNTILTSDFHTNPFFIIGNQIFQSTFNRDYKIIVRSIWPAIFYGMGLRIFSVKLDKFFKKLITSVFESRQYTPTSKHDLVDLVLSLKKNNYISGDSIRNLTTQNGKKVNLEVNDEMLIGQCVGMFAAGFETTSTTTSFTLYELAKNQDAQRRVIAEVDSYAEKHEGKLVYECVSELPYLEACITEALRFYPVLGVLTREVMEDYTFPDGLRLEKGVRVHIPVYHIHRLPEFFPEPEKYRPERFLSEEKDHVKPYTLLSFGEGPRICIGMRFAKMQMLPALVTIFRKYRVELAEGTPLSMPLEPAAIVTQPRFDINLKFIRREI